MSFMDYVLPVFVEPEINYNFIVMVGIRPFGEFRTVSGAGISHTPLSLVEGGRNHSPHLMAHAPGSVSQWGEVTLQWGTLVWSTLYDWADAVRVGRHFRRDVFVIQLARNGLPTRLMRFAGAWPRAWKASGLDTSSTEWAAEEITLVYEDFNMILTRITALGEVVDRIRSAAEAKSGFPLFGEEAGARMRYEDQEVDVAPPDPLPYGEIPRSVDLIEGAELGDPAPPPDDPDPPGDRGEDGAEEATAAIPVVEPGDRGGEA
jgi:phage tail-like protein